MKKGSYYIRKAQDHDHSLETLVIPSSRNESVSKYHKLKKKLKDANVELNKLKTRLERTRMKNCRYRIQEKIHNLRKLVKKVEAYMEKVTDVKDRINDECAIDPNSKQTR